MQTISDELKASLAKKNPVYKKTVELHRRLWSGGVYVYDTAIDITDQVKQYSPIRWKFDNESFNTWALDNTSLVFRNDRNQWKQDNVKGYFPGLYLLAGSKIVIKFGAQLADGSFEVLRSFTGYISGDPISDPSGKHATITIQGGMSIFSKKSAEEISTLVTDELLGENTGTEFTTDYNGVGIIIIVKRGLTLAGATEIKPTIDYTAADLNKKALPLKITLVTDLTAGEKLYCSYRYWFQDKTPEWLVKEVLTLNGIADHSGVNAAVFSSSIENTWDFNSQADWNTCGKVNIDTITTPGAFKAGLIDDFGDGDYSANPEWTVLYGSGFSINNNRLKMVGSSTNSTIITPMTQTVGSWQFRLYASLPTGSLDWMRIYFMATGADAYDKRPLTGYFLAIQPVTNQTFIQRADGVTLITINELPTSATIIRIERSAAGVIGVYFNEVLKGTSAADLTYTTSDRFAILTGINLYTPYYFNELYIWASGTTPGTAVLTSPVKDAGVDVTSWGKLAATYTANGATIAIETYTSDTIDFSTGNDPAGWAVIDGVGQIGSDSDKVAAALAMRQFIKYRVPITLASMLTLVTPVFDRITIAYYTSTTVISLVDLTGMTCKQVLDLATEMPAYEQGFKANETFVYRPRSTGVPPVIELRSDTNVKNLRNVSPGIERVKNRVVAEFGIYRVVSDASADAQPNSIDKYDTREYQVSSSNLLPADNVNIAYAIAPTILAYTKAPRKRATVDTMFLPQLELGDTAPLYFNEPTALRRWLWGDTDVLFGMAELEYYDDDILVNRYNFWGTVMRIEGIELNPETFLTSLNLVEVI